MSERVTWEFCPCCGTLAALAWRGGTLVDVDCPGGCRVSPVDFTRRAPMRRTFQYPAPVAPRKVGAETGVQTSQGAASPADRAVPS